MQPSGCMTRRVEGKVAYRVQRLTWTLRPPVSEKLDAAATSGLDQHFAVSGDLGAVCGRVLTLVRPVPARILGANVAVA